MKYEGRISKIEEASGELRVQISDLKRANQSKYDNSGFDTILNVPMSVSGSYLIGKKVSIEMKPK